MDCSSGSYQKKSENHGTEVLLIIVQHYVAELYDTSPEELHLSKNIFMVPSPEIIPKGQYCINLQFKLLKEFISFLVRLLYHKPAGSSFDQIKNLEKELRFLLTVLGDTSLTEDLDLYGEFAAVANKAGKFVHCLIFSTDVDSGMMDERLYAVLNCFNPLKADIMKLSHLVPCMSRSTYETSELDSLLVLDLLVQDLEDLMNRDDDLVVDVKDPIRTLHQRLIFLQPFIKDKSGSPQDQLKECYMRIGELAHQARHLVISFLAGDAPRWYLVNRIIHVIHKIELCRIELSELVIKYKSGCVKVAEYVNKQLPSSLPRRNTVVDDDVVGSEDKMIYMLDHLVGGGIELRVISIIGMPGLGKTTLAKKLYNHPLVSKRFKKFSWYVDSQIYMKQSVLANILIHIESELGEDKILEMEEERLVEHIHKTLKGRRYLIVIDDIWDSSVCDELFRCFPDDGNGSRVLVITRNKEVAPPNCIMYTLPSLSTDQSWKLLEKKVFGKQPCLPELVETGRELAANCHGIPLAVVVTAGILATSDKEKRAWENVRRNLSSHILNGGDNSVMQILKLSYDHLPQHLKLCFLYLGVSFKHRNIPTRLMMNRWIAEGFIYGENKKNAAEEYLLDLIDRSLVMVPSRRPDGGSATCMIHDLLLELCLKICEEEKLMRFVNKSFVGDRPQDHMKSTTWTCCQYMGNHFGGRRRSTNYQIEVPDMRLLRVLYFDSSSIYLTGIEYLVCLKYLVVDDLPPSVGNLVNLEYLIVTRAKWVCLPSKIMKMKKLKYMEAFAGAIYGKDCSTSLENKLEFLSCVLIGNVHDEDMLKCSPHLSKLECIYGRGVIDLSFLTRLESLTIQLDKDLFRVEISLPSSIKELTLYCQGVELCRETFLMFGRLENLEALRLMRIGFEGNRWDTRNDEFQKLRYLKMYRTCLTQWNVGSSQHFPKLQKLCLLKCVNLGEIPTEIGKISTLQTIEVDEYLEPLARRIQEEQRDMENEDLTVIYTDSKRFNP